MTPRSSKRRDPEAVLRFVERFASGLADAGMPRMPARVFVALLATDSGRLTAAELAEFLQVSPAAVSSAISYLAQLNMVTREREPGSRREYYRVLDDVWYEMSLRREHMLTRWEAACREGIQVLGRNSTAGTRVAEALAYLEFIEQELPDLLKRWRKRKAELGFT